MKEEKIAELKEEMAHVIINLPDRRASLLELCEKGVKNRVHYFNFIESAVPKKERTLQYQTYAKKVIWDRGLEFNDGTILRHVENKYCRLFPAPVKEVRERKPQKQANDPTRTIQTGNGN